VQEANNLVSIISQYTQLKHSGGGFMGRCPFPDHAEKTASFSVSESKQVYHCFGCKKSGNIFSFLRDYNGMSFPEAVEYLADKAGISLPEIQDPQKNEHYNEQQDKKKQMLKLNKLASHFFTETLKRVSSDHPIKTYIQRRKLTPETIEEFQIGYAPTEWEGLANHIHRQGISLALADEARLVKARKEGNGYFDIFRDRLMFPIVSASGEVLAFGGRIHDQGEPKYLNSPETLVFNKSKTLYGLAQTAKWIRSEDSVIIVEGYMDLVSLYQAGIKNLAASMGTALTAEHAKLIKRMTNNVVCLFDSDSAGQAAAERSLPLLLAAGLYPKGLILADAKDPDEFVNKFGVEALKQKIDSSPELFNLVLQMWMRDYRGEASQKVKIMDQVRPVFDAIPDKRLKSLYAQELSHRMNVGLDWVRASLTAPVNKSEYSRPAAEVSMTPPSAAVHPDSETKARKPLFSITGAPQAEILLLQLSLKSRANFDLVLNSGGQQILSQISHLGVKSLFEKAEQVYRQDESKFDRLTSLLIEYVDAPEMMFSNSSDLDEEKEKKMISDCVKRIQQLFLKDQAKKMGQGINKNDTEKLKEIEAIYQSRISLNKTDKKVE
jgi:DNA primase